MELTLENIKNFINNATTFNLGMDYYREKMVKDVNIQFNRNLNCTMIVANISETKRIKYTVVVMYNEQQNKILSARCDCMMSERNNGICEHVAAGLIAAYYKEHPEDEKEETIEEINEASVEVLEDAYSMLIEKYQRQYEIEVMLEMEQKSVTVVPVIEIANHEAGVSFKLGNKKLYSMKSINKFVENVERGIYFSYGKDLSFTHHLESFTNPNLVSFIIRELQDRDNECRLLKLKPTSFDEFFWRFGTDKMNVKWDGVEKVVKRHDILPHITLMFEEQDDCFILSLRNPMYYIAGNMYGYYVTNNGLYYCSSEFHTACGNLLSYFNEHSKLSVKKEKMQDFYNSVLVEVRGYMQFYGDLEEYLPSAVTNRLYIDLDKNVAKGYLMHYYGEDAKYIAFKDDYVGNNRNTREELKAKLVLRKYVTSIDQRNGSFEIRKSMDEIYEFFSGGLRELSKFCDIYASERVRKINIVRKANFKVGVRFESNLLKLDFTSDLVSPKEMADVLKAYRAKQKFYKLHNGMILQLENESMKAITDVVDSLHVEEDAMQDGKIDVPAYRSLTLDSTLKQYGGIDLDRDEYYRQLVASMKTVVDSEYAIPDSMKDILRNYQKEGYRWLKTMAHYGFGGILADDMGIGKTIQVIALLEDLKQSGSGKSLVICPSSLILNWDSEIHKFTSDLKTHLIVGSQEERADRIQADTGADVWITSYDYMKRDYKLYEEQEFEYLIIDEAQFIKNQNTKNAISVKNIHSKHKFALTGTPIENSLSELWSIFDFLMPNYLFDYSFFKKYYETPITKFQDDEVLSDLKKMVDPFVLRRVKKDVLKELPEKIESTIMVEFDEKSKQLYDANLSLIRNDLETQFANGGNNRILVIAMLTKLRQLCCAPSLLYENFDGENVKLNACMEIVHNCKDSHKKVLIFSQFTSLLDIIEQTLIKEDISYYKLTGATGKAQRQAMVNAFNQDDTEVFLISLKAGGTGLNLTGAECVIHFDPWWNLSAQNQATDRAHRFGQEKNVQVFKLIVKNSIEEKIMELQEQKKDLSDAIINENEGIITSMSKDDILDLFK